MIQNTCRNCGNQFEGKFCNACGEKVYRENDRSLSKLFHETFHFITHFEGTFLTTLKTIITSPGKMSLDYCNGVRKKYFKPLSFFLMLVILYLLFPLFEGLNMKLHYHAQQGLYGEYASRQIESVMKTKGISMEELEDIFHRKGEKTSKFLLFSIIPVMALFSWLLGFKKRKYYFDHFIFCTEASSFFILWGFLLLPLLLVIMRWLSGAQIISSEWQTGLVIVTVFIVFLTIAARRFFRFRYWYSLLYAILFMITLFAFIESVYKFILFYISIHLV